MIGRAARLAAAVAASLVAAAQARTWRAEDAYERGLAAAEEPSRDAPGRAEAYEAARAEDPANPLYALRAGQVLVARATRRPRPDDAAEILARAEAQLRDAIRLQPLEGRAHDALAQVLVERGDLEGAALHTTRSLAAGPRRPTALVRAAERMTWAWRRTRDPDVLTVALDAARLGFELADGRAAHLPPLQRVPGAHTVGELLTAPGGPSPDDLTLALRGREDLRPTAVRLLGPSRPGDAARLRAAEVRR